jgi:hypothetical protein
MTHEIHKFIFRGTNTSLRCEEKEPHPPHIRGSYNTVIYGPLSYFCLGQAGRIKDGYLRIRVETSIRGSAEIPGYACGSWWIEKGGEEERGKRKGNTSIFGAISPK